MAALGLGSFDEGMVRSANLDLRRDDDQEPHYTSSRAELQSKFRQFLGTHKNDAGKFIYRDALVANYMQGEFHLSVSLSDLAAFDTGVLTMLLVQPEEILPVLRAAAMETVAPLLVPRQPVEALVPVQLMLRGLDKLLKIRELQHSHVGRIIAVTGIVVQAGKTRIKATRLSIMCKNCRRVKMIPCGAGFGGTSLPRRCDTPHVPDAHLPRCPIDPYIILADSSEHIDQQKMRLQENPEHVPTGEMPRHIDLSLEKYHTEKVKPGTRVVVTGIYTTFTQKKSAKDLPGRDVGIRIPYVEVLGIEPENKASEMLQGKFSTEDAEEVIRLSRRPDLYKAIADSIAPAIFGRDDIKKAVACMLFGGSRKHLPDGMRLRGDINVLLLGDPSTAKSQFLKFASNTAPIAVMTSGKGASAAGLTASVIRDGMSGEFHLEGGALVLADGGLVCIDEFDKMKEQDRVAIHEAMEQQTISIAKAGITTILNSRTSVLAAANPVFGRYDDMKSATDNINFQQTILSRFDLIFIIRDVQNENDDSRLAKQVIGVHRSHGNALPVQEHVGVIQPDLLKKYIAYARSTVRPHLSESAAETLLNKYVNLRKTMRQQKEQTGKSTIPITVRQLEAVVRIAESLAKMELLPQATDRHVEEALRLFNGSTMKAATQSGDVAEGFGTPEFVAQVRKAERYIESRIAIGNSASVETLIKEGLGKSVSSENALNKAIDVLVAQGKMVFKNQRKRIERIKP